MKKIKISSETVYFIAILIISLSVAMVTATDYGVSMIVAPAYLISLKSGFLSFGQCEYIVQGLLFIVFCIIMRKVKLVYFSSFVTGLIYGVFLDFWRMVIPWFNPMKTPVGSLPVVTKLILFIVGMCATSLSIAMFFRTYIYPQVYDFFVKGITEKYSLDRSKFKIIFDFSCLGISVVMSLLMFKGIRAIGIGTIVTTVCNGVLIHLFGKLIDRFFVIEPAAVGFSRRFELVTEE